MSRIQVLDSSRYEEWDNYLNQMNGRDIYYRTEYFKLFENQDQRAEVFIFSIDGQMVMYPYLLRSIHQLPAIQAAGLEGEWFDISTPYGYGGPISNVPPGAERSRLFREFSTSFTEYCRHKQILTEFIRFHPLAGNAADVQQGLMTEWNRNTVYIDLSLGTERELLKSYRSNHKRNVQKAKSSQIVIKHSHPVERIEEFTRLYYGTMGDLNADEFYFFPRDFIDDTFRHLQGRLELFEVVDGDYTVATSMILHEKPWMHYHLCGWDRNYMHWSPTKLLIHEAAVWGMEHGFDKFHLGGGYTGEDKLFQFKSGFNSRNEPLRYHLGKRIFFPDHYNRLFMMYGNEAKNDYFPIYRKPLIREESMA